MQPNMVLPRPHFLNIEGQIHMTILFQHPNEGGSDGPSLSWLKFNVGRASAKFPRFSNRPVLHGQVGLSGDDGDFEVVFIPGGGDQRHAVFSSAHVGENGSKNGAPNGQQGHG